MNPLFFVHEPTQAQLVSTVRPGGVALCVLRRCQCLHFRVRAEELPGSAWPPIQLLVNQVQEQVASENHKSPALPSAWASQQSLLEKKQVPSFPGHQKARLRPKKNKAKYLRGV